MPFSPILVFMASLPGREIFSVFFKYLISVKLLFFRKNADLTAKANEYLLNVSATDVNDFITKLRQAIVNNVPQGESFVCRGSWKNNYSYVAFGRTTGGETTFILQLRDKVYYAYYLPNVNQYIYEINKTLV
jgi:hypothetical protein